MSSCAAQLLKKYFKNKKARLEVSQPEDGLFGYYEWLSADHPTPNRGGTQREKRRRKRGKVVKGV